MDKIRKFIEWINGKKIYLLSISGMLALTASFAAGAISVMEYAKGMFAFLMAMAGKSALKKTEPA